MPHVISISDIKKTSELSKMCKNFNEPIFITNNGYGDMVIMSMETYEKRMFMNDVYSKVAQAEESVLKGEVLDGFESLRLTREKYGL